MKPSRLALVLVVVAPSAIACGDSDDGGGGSSGQGGTTAADGSAGAGGSSGSAGAGGTSAGTGGTAGDGGTSASAGAGAGGAAGASGAAASAGSAGASGAGTAGAGGSPPGDDCGDMGLVCTKGQICIRHVMTSGPTQTITYECTADPCAPAPLDCSCASSLCGPGPVASCQISMGEVVCRSGGVCASPHTMIQTPSGERPIASLRVGDRVYSVHHGQRVAVPLARVSRTPVENHGVVELTTSEGAVLQISGPHPLGDGRPLSSLSPGDGLGDAVVASIRLIAYAEPHTYDILPASDTGTYFASGVRLGSTLR